MRFVRALLPLLFLSVLVFAPQSAFAAEATFLGPIIPEECYCDAEHNNGVESAPEWGCVLQVIQNTINFAISIGVFIAVIIIAYAGALWMFSSLNSENRTKARTVLINAVVGLLIALSSWILVDFVMKTLYNEGSGFGPWNAILGSGGQKCLAVKQPPSAAGVGATSGSGGVTTGSSTAGCPTCVSLSEKGLSCKSSSSCTAEPNFANKLTKINSSVSWRVTEAYPPTVTHKAACHKNGTCIDAGFNNSSDYTITKIENFADAASAAGLRPVFETSSCVLRDQARAKGISAYCKEDSDFTHITGNHFSVYNN
jgi:type IV secretory pathway VirB2 component (pilin)